MPQYGVAALEKDKPFPADCVLSWIIWVALNPHLRLDMTLVWFALKSSLGIRVSEEEEYAGLDIGECGMEAYPEFTSST